MASKERFSPLCDVHHTPMRSIVLEEAGGADARSYHACNRPDCTRVFGVADGYADRVEGAFDDSRAKARECPVCSGMMYLSEVNHAWKLETWVCTGDGCACVEEIDSPSVQ